MRKQVLSTQNTSIIYSYYDMYLLCAIQNLFLLNFVEISAYSWDKVCIKILAMLGKRVIKSERLKITSNFIYM